MKHLLRKHLLRASVNNANTSVRIHQEHQNPKGLRNGRKSDRSLPIAETLSQER